MRAKVEIFTPGEAVQYQQPGKRAWRDYSVLRVLPEGQLVLERSDGHQECVAPDSDRVRKHGEGKLDRS